jgi:peptidoglycan/LPS O-acetylase OafA/YrhL
MKRLEFLDSLRGIAALYVVIFHTALISVPKPSLPEWAKPIVMFGGSGVMLFFVISGFSLCLTMPRHGRSKTPLASYYLSRFLRIAPLFYMMIIYWYVAYVVVWGVYPGPAKIAANVLFLFNFRPSWQEGVVWASWTIGVEMLFYTFFPFFYAYFDTVRKKLILLAITIGAYFIFTLVANWLPVDHEALVQYERFTVLKFLPIFVTGMIAFDIFLQTTSSTNGYRRLGRRWPLRWLYTCSLIISRAS